MARIADKHGLTNRYREAGSKRLVKRGRPRKYLFGSPKTTHKTSSKKSTFSGISNISDYEMTPKDTRIGCLTIIGIIVVIVLLIVGISRCSTSNKKYVDYDVLTQAEHPILYDGYDAVRDFYRGYENVSVGSYQSHKDVEKPVITALSYLEYDRIYLITLNLNHLDRTFTLDEAIDIAVEYIPVDMIVKHFEFEKAIYKTKADGNLQYECYYIQREKGVEKPGFYFDGTNWVKLKNGFSIIIEETHEGGYIVSIGDDWYDYKYNAWTIGWNETMEKEKATHLDWNFTLEDWLVSK